MTLGDYVARCLAVTLTALLASCGSLGTPRFQADGRVPRSGHRAALARQPSVSGVYAWSGRVVAKASEKFYEIDLEASASRSLRIPQVDEILALSEKGSSGSSYVLGVRGGRLVLMILTLADIKSVPIPEELMAVSWERAQWGLGAGRNGIAISRGGDVYFRSGEEWAFVSAELNSQRDISDAGLVPVVWEGGLLVLIPGGEWGGAVLRMDSHMQGLADACGDKDVDTEGQLRFAVASEGVWLAAVAFAGIPTEVSLVGAEGCRKVPWERGLKRTYSESILDLAVDEAGVVYLLARSGLYQREGEQWTLVRPASDLGAGVEMQRFWVNSMVVRDGHAVLGTNSEGVLAWNLQTGVVRSIRISE